MDNQNIKEILDKLKSDDYYEKEYQKSVYYERDLKKLEDYITNLQQENEDNLKCIKSIKEQLESVINENQRLLNKWFENNNKMVELIGEKEVYNESLKDYKSRCEKANNFIEENWISYKDSKDFKEFDEVLEIFIKEINELYNILNGKE